MLEFGSDRQAFSAISSHVSTVLVASTAGGTLTSGRDHAEQRNRARAGPKVSLRVSGRRANNGLTRGRPWTITFRENADGFQDLQDANVWASSTSNNIRRFLRTAPIRSIDREFAGRPPIAGASGRAANPSNAIEQVARCERLAAFPASRVATRNDFTIPRKNVSARLGQNHDFPVPEARSTNEIAFEMPRRRGRLAATHRPEEADTNVSPRT